MYERRGYFRLFLTPSRKILARIHLLIANHNQCGPAPYYVPGPAPHSTTPEAIPGNALMPNIGHIRDCWICLTEAQGLLVTTSRPSAARSLPCVQKNEAQASHMKQPEK